MKILSIILVVLLIIVALLGAGLQIFLTKGLTTTLNQNIFPAVKTLYGLDMSITDASVNIFKGRAELQGFEMSNLKGYKEPHLLTIGQCKLEIEMMSLFKRDPIVIKQAELNNTTLTVERNQERKFNVKELADALKPVESAEKPEKSETTDPQPSEKKAQPLPVHIRHVAIDANVVYSDTKRDRKFPLKLLLTGSDLFTIPKEGQKSSLVELCGALVHNKDSFATDLNAIIEPIVDPSKPTFNATGDIMDIDAEFITEFLSKNDMKSGAFSISPSITCKQGQLEGSRIDMIFKEFEIFGTNIGDTTLRLPISGTLQQLEYDLSGAFKSLFSKQSADIVKAFGLKELGIKADAKPNEMIVQGLTNSVKEVADSPAIQDLIEQVIPGSDPSTKTNKPSLSETLSDVLFEQLEKNVDEVEESDSDAIKGLLKGIFK
ncbi:MAG: AsmA family protein [Kiritimatiellaceae bacterium]|nr:AsmA family protein [Kiritimatiellaceae bacterium]